MVRTLFPVSMIGFALAAGAADAPRVFTRKQARAGQVAYETTCGLCHQNSLLGRSGAPGEKPDVNTLPANYVKTIDDSAGQVPPLVGPSFMARWGAKSTKDYVARVSNAIKGFPPVGTNADTAVLLVAYFLKANGGKPGSAPLTAETSETLNHVTGRPTQQP
jgi:mono/diheme cytochrome c family protein